MPIELIDMIKPKNNGKFPILDAVDIKGGHHTLDTMEELLNMPENMKVVGMTCYVRDIEKRYVLKNRNGNIEWLEDKAKGGVEISDTPPTGDDKHEIIWVDNTGDMVQLPDDPTHPTLAAIQATLVDYQNRIDTLEYITRGIIDGGNINQNTENTQLVDPNITKALIKFKRGNSNDLCVLQAGEPAVTLDTGDLYVGDGKGGVIHINSAKNVTENKVVLRANNNKLFALTVSPEGFINVTEVVDEVISPEPIGDYTVTIKPSIKIATNGDYIYFENTIIYTGADIIFNVPIIDTLLLDNMNINSSDISKVICSRVENADNLFSSGIVIPKLHTSDIIYISYYLQINENVHENITHSLMGKENTIEIY